MVQYLKSLAKRYGKDEISTKAAALSYFTIFSIGPLLFIIFGIIGEVLKNEVYKTRLLDQLDSVVGPEAGSLVNEVLQHQTLSSRTGIAFAIGIVGLVLGALGIFGQLQKSIDDILRVRIGPDAGLVSIIKQRIISLGLVGVFSFLLLVSLVATAAASELVHRFSQGSVAGTMIAAIDFVVSLIVFSILLALIYRTLPEVKLPWKIVFSASVLVALFFSIGKAILALIIGSNESITAFGAAGSLIALLLWIFYSGQIIFLGASGIKLYTETHNVPLEPRYKGKKGVLRIREVEEPLGKSLAKEATKEFAAGFKKGLKEK